MLRYSITSNLSVQYLRDVQVVQLTLNELIAINYLFFTGCSVNLVFMHSTTFVNNILD